MERRMKVRTMAYVWMAFNLTGWPAAVVRCGTASEGLPIGVQIVGPPWREDVVLAVARSLRLHSTDGAVR